MRGSGAVTSGRSLTSRCWSAIVLLKLREGPKRLSRLRREVVGLPQHALSQTLRKLEQEGAVAERRALTIPPSVKYELTDVGRSMLESAAVGSARAKACPRGVGEARTSAEISNSRLSRSDLG
ncbi:winged helix-turn-helix transcriptional regulator [Bradyrhizobium sp. AZCC 1577]|uniref:winged helix-turn-helix transcriptional regulator n=1 Tax=Bradyrhizobium sp. AZCC 1577 TaxID=3117019 RepID=UPI003FA611CE